MNAVKFVASILIIVGLAGLVYGRFDYTRDTQEAKIGPLELSVKDTETVVIPVWVGVGAVVVGGGLLLFASRKR
jgi:TRAP-type C4-dicarboxylate transport system permease small subunit